MNQQYVKKVCDNHHGYFVFTAAFYYVFLPGYGVMGLLKELLRGLNEPSSGIGVDLSIL